MALTPLHSAMPAPAGAWAFADPNAGIGFAYVMNQMQVNLDGDTRAGRLVNAIYNCSIKQINYRSKPNIG